MSSSFDDMKTATRMNKCRCNNCDNLKVHDAPDCGNHGEPHKCATCDGMASKMMTYCTLCQRVRKQESRARKAIGLAAEPKVKASKDRDEGLIFTRHVPKPRPTPIMTDEEQRRIDKESMSVIHARCGYGNGAPKVYTAAEIEAVKASITPIHKIPRQHFSGQETWL